ncbi:MBL fold metallo-hydrolase [Virgibacillus dokdonensis]|uniref:MBL fold metallo-hydrolase n=1 Tax=Virgibacillus dokdonensis TaxID=302167 RepID=A0A3E0WQG9_9BACI|nr:rhodanese-like domain-containing protein [Virgibacillus dokdonensis]RFA35068.1 MBL fold metallo-hydrolase [Virgibacillus dokdonensis]
MLLQYFYDDKLAQASYLVGCQAKGEAVVVDPARNIEAYLSTAEKEGMKIVGALETHIHADYVSGAREIADRVGATLYVSDEGDADWKYENLDSFSYKLLKDGDTITLGNLTFEVMHTPGHTPESISFLLTDGGANADEPIGIFTGDFVFVGDVGRPDLLEKAAGVQGTSEPGAKEMFHSLERFKQLPDFLQVWPAHGAGSACGKSLGAVPSSTVGYEKRFNWALQYNNETDFTQALLEGQPEPPVYFAIMKHVNKVGPSLLRELDDPKEITAVKEIETLVNDKAQIVDTREAEAFSQQHIPGTINIPFNPSFTNWAGWLINYDDPLYLLCDPNQTDDILTALRSIGIDLVRGFMDAEQAIKQAKNLESYANISPQEAKQLLKTEAVTFIDVRNQSEWDEGHIEGAKHIMLGTLKNRLDEVPNNGTILITCQSGGRSAIGASLLQAKGYKHVQNVTGGYTAWTEEVS